MENNKSKFRVSLGMLFACFSLIIFLPSESFAQTQRGTVERSSRSDEALAINNRANKTRSNNPRTGNTRENNSSINNRSANTRRNNSRVNNNRSANTRGNNSSVNNNRSANTRGNNSRINNNRVANARANTRGNQFRNFPRRGTRVNNFPRTASNIRFRNTNYRYNRGIFYRPHNGGYIVARAPIGIRITILPPNPFRFVHFGRDYFYHYGTYYIPRRDGYYEVVDAPIGAIVDYLPDGYEIFEIDGRVYYYFDGIYYKAIVEYNGNVVYQVVRV